MWHLFCYYLFLISHSFGASFRVCYVIDISRVSSLTFYIALDKRVVNENIFIS